MFHQSLPARSGAVAALLLTLSVTVALAAAPRLVADEPLFDAGTVGRGELITHVFVLRNEGDAPLVVREVRPGCGCTVAEFDRDIAPGGIGEVTAVVDTKSFRGPISKPVSVYTNDSKTPALRLTIKAQVQPYVEASPGYVRFEHVVGQDAKTDRQLAWSNEGDALEVLDAESTMPFVTVDSRLATDAERDDRGPEHQWLLTTTLAADAPVGPVVGSITVTTNNERSPTLEIPLAGYVRPLISLQPTAVDFGQFAPKQPRRASLVVTNNGPGELSVTEVEGDLSGLETEVREHREGKQFQIILTLNGLAQTGPFAGTLRIHTDDESFAVLEVPMKGVVR